MTQYEGCLDFNQKGSADTNKGKENKAYQINSAQRRKNTRASRDSIALITIPHGANSPFELAYLPITTFILSQDI
jgi:hypothetical protein